MTRIGSDDSFAPGSLIRIVGEYETFCGQRILVAPVFVVTDPSMSLRELFYPSNQVHIPLGSLAVVTDLELCSTRPGNWCLYVIYDGMLLKSFYTYSAADLKSVFATVSDFDQCIG